MKDKNQDHDSEAASTQDSENKIFIKGGHGSVITITGRAESNFIVIGVANMFHGKWFHIVKEEGYRARPEKWRTFQRIVNMPSLP